MTWLLTLIVSCVTVYSTESCNLAVKEGKILLPKQSWSQGAKFRSHTNAETREICQQGCCEAEQCDTILYTANKVDKQGDNCFLFDCHDVCVFRDASPSESNYTVAVLAPTSTHFDLPDFSNLIVTTKPDTGERQENSTESHGDLIKKLTQSAEEKVQTEESFPFPVEPDNETADVTADAPDTAAEDNVSAEDATVKDISGKDTTVKNQETTVKPDEKDSAPVDNKVIQTEPTQHTSIVNQPVTVKDNAEKPDKTIATDKETAPKPAKPVETDKTVEDKEESTPTEKPTVKLPNEVPVMKGNETKPEQKEGGKGKITESKKPSVVVVDKPQKNATKAVSIEVEIDTVNKEVPETYTNRDVVFWISVVGGSTLIALGLIVIIRYYSNKRRRLYSSLTDDYLINGMYSI